MRTASLRDTDTGTPQGSILSPLLSNVALSVLDEHIAQAPGGPAASPYQRAKRRARVCPTTALSGTRTTGAWSSPARKADAEALREEIAGVLSTMGLRLSPEKTLITHIDEGLDFLGWRIQRHRKRGTNRSYVYTYPARKALRAVTGKVKTLCRRMDTNQPLEVLLLRLNRMLRGWCAYFRPGVSSATFAYLSAYTWARVIGWLRRKHRRITWKELRRRYCGGRMVAGHDGTGAVQPGEGAHHALPIPGSSDPGSVAGHGMRNHTSPDGACGAPVARKRARRVREAARGNPPVETPAGRPGSTSPDPAPAGRDRAPPPLIHLPRRGTEQLRRLAVDPASDRTQSILIKPALEGRHVLLTPFREVRAHPQGGAQSRFGWSWAGFRLLAQAEDGEQERRVVADLP